MLRGFCDLTGSHPGFSALCSADLHMNTHSRVGFHRHNINITRYRYQLQASNGFMFETLYSESISNTVYKEMMDVGLSTRSINRPGNLCQYSE
jgi:hypothetical protein